MSSGGRRPAAVSFLLDERGTFVDAPSSLTGQPIREVDPSAVLVGDFTGDGRTDVLLADEGGPESRGGRVRLLVGDGQPVRLAARPAPGTSLRVRGRERSPRSTTDGQIDVFVDNAPGSARSELWYGRGDANGGPAFQNVVGVLPEAVTRPSADYTAATFVAGAGPLSSPRARASRRCSISRSSALAG